MMPDMFFGICSRASCTLAVRRNNVFETTHSQHPLTLEEGK